MAESVHSGHISGDGLFTKKCCKFFSHFYSFHHALLTTSCTHALEMASILLDIAPGDEVIIPSFTFVSTANAFALRGATIVFADSSSVNPNIDAERLEELITPKTKAIVPVHYAGVSCDMGKIFSLANAYNLKIVEDAAQAIDSFYLDKPLGGLGCMSAFSFHETKNIICGEGGMFVVNDSNYLERAEIIREKGTNRSQFFRGNVDKYTWVDVGSSYLPSDMLAAYLFAQLESLSVIQSKRLLLWNQYQTNLSSLSDRYGVLLPDLPSYATCNAHMFYLVCTSLNQRSSLINYLSGFGVKAVFHYQSLHASSFYSRSSPLRTHDPLPNAEFFSDCLVRLPLYCELEISQVDWICELIHDFFRVSRASVI